MNRSTKHLIIVVALLLVGLFLAPRLFPSRERKVRRQFALLSKTVSKDSRENPITTATKINKLRSLFAENCSLRTRFSSFSGDFTREEIVSLIAQARLECSTLTVKFYDLQVEFPDDGIAKATLTIQVNGTMTDGSLVDETHELECMLNKSENKWLFSECRLVEVLER